MDLRRSADGVWVLFHDSTLDRMAGEKGEVARISWEGLKRLGIPSVEEALALCRRKKRFAFLDIKLRSGEKQLLQVLRRSKWLSHVWIGVGTVPSLRRWRRLLSRQPLFWVTGYRAPITPGRIRQAHRLRLTGLAVYRCWVTQAVVRRVHEHGLKLFVWTARTPREIRRLARLGVDGIMSEVWPPPRSI